MNLLTDYREILYKKISVFRDVAPRSVVKFADVSEMLPYFIFRALGLQRQQSTLKSRETFTTLRGAHPRRESYLHRPP
jgi:hypothetical protein